KSLDELSLLARLKIASYGACFYVVRTLVPTDLHPLYSIPGGPGLDRLIVWSALVACVTLSAIAVWQWRRRPWLAVVWFSYLALLAPVSGLAQAGPQIAADRYSYLPGMVLAIALGGLVLAAGTQLAERGGGRLWIGVVVMTALVICLMATLANAQTR